MSKPTWVSPSQIEVARLCVRKWWLSKVKKLPEGEIRGGTFGTVLHSVCERFLKADDLGRDPATGQAANIFPEGWEQAVNRFSGEVDGEVSGEEAALIRTLVGRAIESGVLQRKPGRRVEHQFRIPFSVPHGEAMLTGLIDCAYPDAVEDHKTSKATRWFQSPRSLSTDTAMILYAVAIMHDAEASGRPVPDRIALRHNQFCKDPDRPVVRKTEALVLQEDVVREWNKILLDVDKMLRYKAEATKWSDLPDPPDLAEACNAYGGCPYRTICAGRETEAGYSLRVREQKEQAKKINSIPLTVLPAAEEQKDTTVSAFLDILKARQASANGTPAPAPVQSPVQSTPAPEPAPAPGFVLGPTIAAPEPAPAPEQELVFQAAGQHLQSTLTPGFEGDLMLPPWVTLQEVSGANGGIGFNYNGEPDIGSTQIARNRGYVTPDLFDVTNDGGGIVSWKGKPGTRVERLKGRTRYRPDAPVKAQEVEAPAPPPPPVKAPRAKRQKAEPAPAPTPAPVEPPVQSPGQAPSVFTLLINVAVNVEALSFNTMIGKQHKALAEANGAASYYHLDAFKRRDAMCAWAEEIAPTLTGFVMVDGVSRSDPDLIPVVSVLRSKAAFVVMPTY